MQKKIHLSKHWRLPENFQSRSVEKISNSKVNKWSSDTIKVALGLRFSYGTSGYQHLLQLSLPYPSVRTLQRRLSHIKFECGILDEIFDMLKIKVSYFTEEREMFCTLLLDEMYITQAVEFDISTKTYFGNVTFPNQSGKASHALVFMLGGISTRWKQVVAFYFTNGHCDGEVLKHIIIDIIKRAEDIGLRIMRVTSDMGSSNQAVWRKFGIVSGRCCQTKSNIVHPFDDSRVIEFIADVPHLLKNIKSALLSDSNKYFLLPDSFVSSHSIPSAVVSGEHLQKFSDYQEDMDLKLAPKLSSNLLHDNHFDKMKVSRATSVMSHSVSAGLQFMSEDKQDGSLLATAWFIKYVNRWFKLMTSRHPVMALSKMNHESYVESVSFLKKFIDLFQNLKIINKNGKAV